MPMIPHMVYYLPRECWFKESVPGPPRCSKRPGPSLYVLPAAPDARGMWCREGRSTSHPCRGSRRPDRRPGEDSGAAWLRADAGSRCRTGAVFSLSMTLSGCRRSATLAGIFCPSHAAAPWNWGSSTDACHHGFPGQAGQPDQEHHQGHHQHAAQETEYHAQQTVDARQPGAPQQSTGREPAAARQATGRRRNRCHSPGSCGPSAAKCCARTASRRWGRTPTLPRTPRSTPPATATRPSGHASGRSGSTEPGWRG